MNDILNILACYPEKSQVLGNNGFLNGTSSEGVEDTYDVANLELANQQAQAILLLRELGKKTDIASGVFESLESKLCCFLEKLSYSQKYRFSDVTLKALREDSLYLTLSGNQNISVNMFVDNDDFDNESKVNEMEVFLSYSKKGKDYITCDSISNIFSIIESL